MAPGPLGEAPWVGRLCQGCCPPARWQPRLGLPSTPPSRSGGWTRARSRLLGPGVPHWVIRLRRWPGRTLLSGPCSVRPELGPQPKPKTETHRAGGPPLTGVGREGELAAPWVPPPGEAPHPRVPALLWTQTCARMAEKPWQWLAGRARAVGGCPPPRQKELSRVAGGPWLVEACCPAVGCWGPFPKQGLLLPITHVTE